MEPHPPSPTSTDEQDLKTDHSQEVDQELDTEKSANIFTKVEDAGEVYMDPALKPGHLTLDEVSAGGVGRHLGLFSTTFLVIGRIIGTGIFSTPSSILTSVGSVGASMMLWTLGGILSVCGLCVWLELACIFPRSGGEKVYLEAIYRRPKLLATIMYAVNAIFLGFTASGCIVFASNILVAAHYTTTSPWVTRGIGLGVITFVTLIHGLAPKSGVRLMNLLGICKVFILLLVVVSGWVVLGGHVAAVPDPMVNFRNGFEGSSHVPYNYASALFKVLNSYSGYTNVFYVVNEIRNPVRTIKIAAPLGLGICTILYLFANISYFAVLSLPALKASGVTVASYYFLTVFGPSAQRALSVFVALSALGNVLTVTFAQSRVNQELAKEGVLPYSGFWSSNWPTGKSPMPGLIVHLIPSAIIIIAPPAAIVYPFILDVEGYPGSVISLLVAGGLLWLRYKHPEIVRPFKVFLPAVIFFMLASVFLLVVPLLPPPGLIGDTPPIPYYVYCLVGLSVYFFGFLYWAVWAKLMPKVGKYRLEAQKVILDDGVVTTQYKKIHIE